MNFKKASTVVIVIITWLITAALGLWEIQIVLQMFNRLFAYFSVAGISGYQAFLQVSTANTFVILIGLVLAIIWIGAFIGGAEYHRRHLGEPGSWMLFTRTAAVELAILLLVFFI